MMNDLIYNLDENFPLVALCGIIIIVFCLVYRLGKLAFVVFACLALLTFYYEVWPVFTGEVDGVFAQIWDSPYLFDKFNALNFMVMIGNALLVVLFYKFQARKLAGVLFFIGIGLYLVSEFGYFLESYFVRVGIPYGCIVWLDGDLITILIGSVTVSTHAIIHRKQQVVIQQINQQFVLQVKEMVRTTLYRRSVLVITGCGLTLGFTYLFADFLSGFMVALFISVIIALYTESVAAEKAMNAVDTAARIIRVRAAVILKGITSRISLIRKAMVSPPQNAVQIAAIEGECLGQQPKKRARTIIDGDYENECDSEYESEEERKYAQYVRRRMKENQSQSPKRPATELLPESCVASNTSKRTINGTINDKEKVGSDSECINAIPFRKSSTPSKVKKEPLPSNWNTLTANRCTCGQDEDGNPDKRNRAGESKSNKSDTVGSKINISGRVGSDMQKTSEIPKNFLRDIPSDLRDCFADVKNAEARNDFIAACNILFRILARPCGRNSRRR